PTACTLACIGHIASAAGRAREGEGGFGTMGAQHFSSLTFHTGTNIAPASAAKRGPRWIAGIAIRAMDVRTRFGRLDLVRINEEHLLRRLVEFNVDGLWSTTGTTETSWSRIFPFTAITSPGKLDISN
ncbi:MAG: hypothetical protein MUP44_02620, partial [Anaerolineales bacterium]|nr:hypothetical protein [Anaerolineales bacterium]